LDNNLEEKINNEIGRINKLFDSGKLLLALCKLKEPDFIEITAAAQILHSFYNGVESVVILFLKSIIFSTEIMILFMKRKTNFVKNAISLTKL
jgi:hypothetical protein